MNEWLNGGVVDHHLIILRLVCVDQCKTNFAIYTGRSS